MTSIRSSSALTILLASAMFLAGCAAAPVVQYLPVKLPIAQRPVLTPIAGSALQCLAPAAYTQIVNRERSYKTWGLENEATIKANNLKAKGQ